MELAGVLRHAFGYLDGTLTLTPRRFLLGVRVRWTRVPFAKFSAWTPMVTGVLFQPSGAGVYVAVTWSFAALAATTLPNVAVMLTSSGVGARFVAVNLYPVAPITTSTKKKTFF